MKVTTGDRLNQIMAERNLKQVDILTLTKRFAHLGSKITKTDLSQYVNYKTEPRQDKLYVLAKALDVNEAWLMGYDVPKERITEGKPETIAAHHDGEEWTEEELEEIEQFKEFVRMKRSQQE